LFLVVVAPEKKLAAEPAKYQALVRALVKANRFVYANKARAVEIAVKYAKIPRDVVEQAYDELVKGKVWAQNDGLPREKVEYSIERMVIVGLVVGVGRAADAVTRLDVEAEPVTLPENDGGGPDLDLALHRLTGLEPPPLVVHMVRAVRQRALGVELAVRGAEPSFCQRHRLALRPDLERVLPIRPDVAQRRVDVHVLRRARHPQRQHDRSGNLSLLLHEWRLERNAGAAGATVTVRRHRTATGRVSKLGRVLRRRRCEPALRRVRVSRRLALDLEIHLAPLR